MYLCLLSCLVATEPATSPATKPASVAPSSSTVVNLFATNELAAADVPKQAIPSTAPCLECLLARQPAEKIGAPKTEGVALDPTAAQVVAPGVNVRVRSVPGYSYGNHGPGYRIVTSGSESYYTSEVSYESGARKHRVRGLLHRIFHRP